MSAVNSFSVSNARPQKFKVDIRVSFDILFIIFDFDVCAGIEKNLVLNQELVFEKKLVLNHDLVFIIFRLLQYVYYMIMGRMV